MIAPFKLERYFARYEFQARYLLSASDCESLSLQELLNLADADSLALWQSLNLGYTESLGLPALREEIAHLYEKVPADNIMTLTPEEGIFICMQTLIKAGDHVISLFPAYQSLYEIARARGCKVTPWLLKAGDTAWELDFDELEGSLQEDTRLLVINFPHNPTGFLPRLPELLRIVDFARAHHLYLFSDEMYRFLEYDPAKRLPPVCDLYEKGISLSGLSKSFALPGLRTGWLATQDEGLFHTWALYKDYTTICSSAPSEVLALAALRARPGITARNIKIIKSNLAIVNPFFERFKEQFNWLPPQAASVAFPYLNLPVSIDDFCRQLIERKDVMLVPAAMFDLPGNHFRIGLGRKNFAEALSLLGDFLAGI